MKSLEGLIMNGGKGTMVLRLAELPESALARLLQLADNQTRANCALVCRTLRSASLVTPKVTANIRYYEQDRLDSLHQWLSYHGGAVTELWLSIQLDPYLLLLANTGQLSNAGEYSMIAQLSFQQLPQLHSLSLQRVEWVKPPSRNNSTSTSSELSSEGNCSTYVNSLLLLTQLTYLSLEACKTVGSRHHVGLSSISALTNLRHLIVLEPDADFLRMQGNITDDAAQEMINYMASFSNALGKLQQLTHLSLASDNEVLLIVVLRDSIGQLPKLLELELGCKHNISEGLAHLPLNITYLVLLKGTRVAPETVPRLTELTSLQHLRLAHLDDFEPSMLANLTQLRHLVVDGEVPLRLSGFLQVLPSLQHLQHLSILDAVIVPGSLPASDTQYTAFVSFSHLTYLDIRADAEDSFLPAGIGQQLFGVSHGLMHLQQLKLGWYCTGDWSQRYAGKLEDLPWQLSPEEMVLLVQCCPRLQTLEIVNAVAAGRVSEVVEGFRALQSLTALTSLAVGGLCVDNTLAIEVLAALTRLRQLEVLLAPNFSWRGLFELTQLQRLERLHVEYTGVHEPKPVNQHSRLDNSELSGQGMPDPFDTRMPSWLQQRANELEFDNISAESSGNSSGFTSSEPELSTDSFNAIVASGEHYRLAAAQLHMLSGPGDSSSDEAGAMSMGTESESVCDDSDNSISESVGSESVGGEAWNSSESGFSSSSNGSREEASKEPLDPLDALEIELVSKVFPPDVSIQLAQLCIRKNPGALFAVDDPAARVKSIKRPDMIQILPIEQVMPIEQAMEMGLL